MGTSNENQTVYHGNGPVMRVFRRNRLAPFVCQWRALQEERAYAMTRLDNFSKEIAEKVANLCRAPWKISDPAPPSTNDLLGDSATS